MKKIATALWLTALAASRAEPPAVQFLIDPTRAVHPISRYIYGVNQPLEGSYAQGTLVRSGGNRLTAYNWVTNASNAGSDWHFQNDNYLGGGDKPGGALAAAIENASIRRAAVLLTIPICGHVSADKKGDGDVRASGAEYLRTRFRESLPGKHSEFTLQPDSSSPKVFQDEFVNWVKMTYPHTQTDPGRPVFLAMDNEPDLWAATHAAIHPSKVTYAEIVEKTVDYAKAIKAVMPTAKIFGPVNYGWNGYTTLQDAPDGKGRDFQEFYLSQLAAAEKASGCRLLDVFDIHWYPEAQGGGKRITGPETTPEVVAARLAAPRSLWDSKYTEESWITKWSTKGPVTLIPRMFAKINKCYPGTQLAITEYNYGGGGHVSGAIAEADVLGIFGREGVFAAAEWPQAKDETFIAAGMAMFRNYDGHEGIFLDTSILAETSEVAATSIYASIESAGSNKMVLVALNKTDRPLEAAFTLAHARTYKVAQVYQLTGAAAAPVKAGLIAITIPTKWTCTLPAFSVSTIELR